MDGRRHEDGSDQEAEGEGRQRGYDGQRSGDDGCVAGSRRGRRLIDGSGHLNQRRRRDDGHTSYGEEPQSQTNLHLRQQRTNATPRALSSSSFRRRPAAIAVRREEETEARSGEEERRQYL